MQVWYKSKIDMILRFEINVLASRNTSGGADLNFLWYPWRELHILKMDSMALSIPSSTNAFNSGRQQDTCDQMIPLRSCSPREPTSQTLNLRANRIKDTGVEAMSCATLGQEYKNHRKRQSQVRGQRRSNPPRVLNATSATKVNAWEAQQSGRPAVECDNVSAVETLKGVTPGDLPPLAGTPLYAAAIGSWPNTRHQSVRIKSPPRLSAWSVVLDGNMVSERVVAGQGALGGLGEVALFRGCVLPETVAANKSWPGDAFWTKTGAAGRVEY